MMSKLEANEISRYSNQHRYYVRRLEDSLAQIEMRLVSLEGQPYDPGMAVTALNAADFGPDNGLMVDQMVEPIIMGSERLVRAGTVMLRKAET